MDSHLSARDPQLVLNIVNHLKSQGIFDQFRRECLADVDTKPSFQNLRQRVEGYVSKFLSQQTWKPDLNKNQLRDALRKQINDSGMLSIGVEHVVDQVVNPQINRTFLPQIESVVRQYLGLERPTELSAFSDKKEEKKENVQSSDINIQDSSQKVFTKIECQAIEKTPEVVIVPEASKKDPEKAGLQTVIPGEIVNLPTTEKLSEVSASTDTSHYPDFKLKNVDSTIDTAPETTNQLFDVHQSTGESIKFSLVGENTSLTTSPEKNQPNVKVKTESQFQDDVKRDLSTVKQSDSLTEMLYDENSVSCADSIEGDSKLIINEDSVMSDINSETIDTGTIASDAKNVSNAEPCSENQFLIKKCDTPKFEFDEIKQDILNFKEDSSNSDLALDANQKDARGNLPVKKEIEEPKLETSVKESHKTLEKGRSPSKHKSSKSTIDLKAKQSDGKSSTKHRHSSEIKDSDKMHKHASEIKDSDKLHKHTSSSKSSSSKSHSEHKSKSSLSKHEQKHKSSSSKSSEKSSKTSELSSSSKIPSNSKSDRHGSEKKYTSSKTSGEKQKQKHSSSDLKSPKVKSSSKDDSKSVREPEDKAKIHSKATNSKSSSSLDKHRSSESSKSHNKQRSKDYSRHSSTSSSKSSDKHKESDSRNKSDSKYTKKTEQSSISSSSKQTTKSSKAEEKLVSENRKKPDDSGQSMILDQPEKSSSSENSNTCDSISKSKELSEKESSLLENKTSSVSSNDDGSIEKQQRSTKENSDSSLATADCSKNKGSECTRPILQSPHLEKEPDISTNDSKSLLTDKDSSSNLVIEVNNNDTSESIAVDTSYSFQGKIKNCDQKQVEETELTEPLKPENPQSSDENSVSSNVPTSSSTISKQKLSVASQQEQLSSKKFEEPTVNVESSPKEEKEDLMKSLVLQKSEDEIETILNASTNNTDAKLVNEAGDDKKSDITVSSVHTSDLSSYDDKISLSSSDELEAVELLNPTVKEKKVALKEIKEVAATYLKSRTNSSGRSTPVLPSGDDDTNQSSTKQAAEKAKLETEVTEKQDDDCQHSDDEDGIRGSSRFGRQRKINPKYASEEYIVSSSWKDADHQPAAVLPAKRMTRRSAEENVKPLPKMGTVTATTELPQTSSAAPLVPGRKRQYSKSSDKLLKEEIEPISEKDEKVCETILSTDHQCTPEEVLTRSKRKSSSRSSVSPDTSKQRAEHQRYSSSDLYKPRPVIGSRRHRTNEETSNSEQQQEQMHPDTSGHPKRARGRPRKRPPTPDPQPASSAKRKR